MKNHSKIGNRKGSPAYRTPALFRLRAIAKVGKAKAAKTSSWRKIKI